MHKIIYLYKVEPNIGMKRILLRYLFMTVTLCVCVACGKHSAEQWTLRTPCGQPVQVVAIDTMDMVNPFICLDRNTLTYYMTGDGGYVWTSKNLRLWTGPYNVLQYDSLMQQERTAKITAPEIHKYNDKYYYTATFTSDNEVVDTVAGVKIPRRTCHIFVSDSLQGPYTPVKAPQPLLNIKNAAMGGTFITDEYGWGFLIYSHDWRQCGDGTTQIIMMTRDLAEQIGDPYVMFCASQNPWSSDNDGNVSPVMDGAFLFDTEGLELGILFVTEKNGVSALGVAYSEKNHGLNGPWHIEPQPMLVGGYGQAMLFNDYDGSLVMALHKDTIIDGRKRSVPQLIEMDSQYDKLKIKSKYNI